MDADRPFAGEPADSREAIMRATFVALQEHGYAGLSIQRIADQAALSKSTFYHHFDDKEELLLSFAQFMLEQFITVLTLEADDEAPRETLETMVDIVLDEDFPSVEAETPATAGEWDILGAYVEVRAQAVRDEAFRDAFTEMDEVLFEHLADVVRRGVAHGSFGEAEPEDVAAMVLTVLGGHLFGAATSDHAEVERVRTELDHYLRSRLGAAE